MRRTLVVLSLAALAAACIVKSTTHTLYLESDASVTWTVLEDQVHSDTTEPAESFSEEQRFLDAITAGEHPVALALANLGGRDLCTTVLRDRRPFTVYTRACFPSLEGLAQALLDQLGLPGTATLSVNDGVSTLRLNLDIDEVAEGDDDERPVLALVEDADAYRLVASSARFVAASGFAIEDDGRTVRFDLPSEEEILARGGSLEVSLSWVEGA
jgi:hypothetical protein